MTSPQTRLNDAVMRAEARSTRHIIGAWLTALVVAAALVLLARMGLQLALDLPEIAARAIALRGM